MTLEEARVRLEPFVGRRFAEIPEINERMDLRTDKGNVGKILERLLGLANTPAGLDFSDGELKTNKCRQNGAPMETIFIKQISSIIDRLLCAEEFESSQLYAKIRNLLLVPVHKDGVQAEWMFLPPMHFLLDASSNARTRDQIRADYNLICAKIVADTQHGGNIHTSSGIYMQIRSKDAQPYNPIFSHRLNRYISNKNHAFYFKKEFMQHLQAHSSDYPFHLA